ncbi:MAG: universal stress protein [Kribbellaceae bacterium]
MGHSEHEHVLVGVDGSPESGTALRWATEEARTRGVGVRVLRAYEVPGPMVVGTAAVNRAVPVADYEADLERAVAYVRARLGYEHGSGQLFRGRAAAAILSEAEDADLVAVGSHRRTKSAAALLGSVSTAVTARAPCPVVVVRGSRWVGIADRIVTGLDGSSLSENALAFAFDHADRHQAPLTVVHCWRQMDHIAADRWSEDAVAAVRTEHDAWMREQVAPYREKYPEVAVELRLAETRPAQELIRLSADAGLMVVGSRGRGGVTGLLLGSVSQSLLHHAHCSVAVVRRA